MSVERGQVWWADLGMPRGSEPGYLRPVVIVQADPLNRSLLGSVMVVPLRGCLGIRTEPGASDVFSGAYERREHARSM